MKREMKKEEKAVDLTQEEWGEIRAALQMRKQHIEDILYRGIFQGSRQGERNLVESRDNIDTALRKIVFWKD